MPELPEVESVRNGLNELIIGKSIIRAEVLWPNIIKDPGVEEFKRSITGQHFLDVQRRGKFLLFVLDDYVLISHLRMEGKFRLEDKQTGRTKHTHVVFELDTCQELRYLDVRKFGKMSLVDKDQVYSHPSLKDLGPEPTEDELSAAHLEERLRGTQRTIKACLLDQKVVTGIGNIYADEVLFEAGIHPERKGSSLSQEEIRRLRQAIVTILSEAVKSGGTTIRTYANAFGSEGNYQHKLAVYGKADEKCSRCGRAIEKIKVAQRGTHYCPHCQK